MSKACASPTARLLQGSRLFSIPKALPASVRLENAPTGRLRNSETATTPYPTHQAIDCPHASRAIGEWGLKRHLPTRTTTKSTTPIRILAQDTNDHVTDFASAGDHSISLEKFQELGVAVLKRNFRSNQLGAQKHRSVYEEALDSTDRAKAGRRWKTNGPWLLGMAGTDLDRFLEELEKRRPEWQRFLREYFAQRDFEAAKKTALNTRGIFGPVELQRLSLQRDHIIPAAEDEVRALREAQGEGATSDIEARSHQIMELAQKRADECEAALETETRQLDAIEHLRVADERAANIRSFADQKLRSAVDDLEAEAARENPKYDIAKARVEIEQQFTAASEDAADVLKAAYGEVIQRFGEEPESDDPAALETLARRLTNDAVATLTAAEAERTHRLREWEERERQLHYPDDHKLEILQKEMRDAHQAEGTYSELTSTLVRFLDLPGIGGSGSRQARIDRTNGIVQTAAMQNTLLTDGLMDTAEEKDGSFPLSTHPGAGLGYLRTNLYMDNHPIHGPQAQRSAVLARVIRPRSAFTGTEYHAKMGVAGFVANDPRVGTANRAGVFNEDQMAASLDPYLVGGNKMYMHATSAHINEAGRVHLTLERSESEAIAVKKGDVAAVLEAKKANLSNPAAGSVLNDLLAFPGQNRPRARYGAALRKLPSNTVSPSNR